LRDASREGRGRQRERGSPLQIQIYVTRRRHELDKAVLIALPDLEESAVALR
jgi:hypothetical protein